MVDIYAFLASMKISWLRRIMDINQTLSAWHNLYPMLHQLEQFGYDYIRVCMNNIKNSFWKDVLEHYKRLYLTKHGEKANVTDLNEEPIHYNTNIKRGRETIYIREWVNQGINKITDLLDEHNQIISYNSFKQKYVVPQTNFITYAGVTRSIKKFLDNVSNDMNRMKILTAKELWNCIRASNIKVYPKFQENNGLPTAVIKWNSEFNEIPWKNIFRQCFQRQRILNYNGFKQDYYIEFYQPRNT